MLNIQTYRLFEQLAKSSIPSWRVSKVHNLDHFEKVGFPVRLNSMQETALLLDTMQENRFQKYMDEMDGFTNSELEVFIQVGIDLIRFQQVFYPNRLPILPISTMISNLALYEKLSAASPNFQRVLEIGPGCGYLSFFLKHHKNLKNYSQIEACESFYLLQSLVNQYCFSWEYSERASFNSNTNAASIFHFPDSETEYSPTINISKFEPKCEHFPWWRLGEVSTRLDYYDVVTSNANLLEFNIQALEDYLQLLKIVLKPSGVFIVQCTGGGSGGLSVEQLIQRISDYGFTPLMFALEAIPHKFSGRKNDAEQLKFDAPKSIKFTTTNAMYVKEGHPSWLREEKRKSTNSTNYISNDPIVDATFFRRKPARKIFTFNELLCKIQSFL